LAEIANSPERNKVTAAMADGEKNAKTSPRLSHKGKANNVEIGKVELKRQNTHGEPHPGKPRYPSNAVSELDHRV
jgi:hypothetical protein